MADSIISSESLFGFFADLIRDAAGGFAGRLTAGLAFATAACFEGVGQITRGQCFNPLHLDAPWN
jgi:hypothetical protein